MNKELALLRCCKSQVAGCYVLMIRLRSNVLTVHVSEPAELAG